jgi:hypothetical protein
VRTGFLWVASALGGSLRYREGVLLTLAVDEDISSPSIGAQQDRISLNVRFRESRQFVDGLEELGIMLALIAKSGIGHVASIPCW